MNTSDFFYDLPENLIAQTPASPRDSSRLLIYDRTKKAAEHRHFYDLPEYLSFGDALVINETKVIPARIFGDKAGRAVEFLLLKRLDFTDWEVIMRPGKKVKIGDTVDFPGELCAKISDKKEDGVCTVRFSFSGVFEDILDRLGQTPLPPYIITPTPNISKSRRISCHSSLSSSLPYVPIRLRPRTLNRGNISRRFVATVQCRGNIEKLADKTRYQTVYAKQPGSAAAPTAGLHFTSELLEKIEKIGVKVVKVLLHIGLGTFRPVKAKTLTDHIMHSEYFEITADAAETLNEVKRNGGRIIAVGTTSVRVLESAADESGILSAKTAETDIFIYPGYKFRAVDSLITNFHLPESTLIMLVSAFCGREETMRLYNLAVEEKYRFFSFGDSMLII